MNWVRLALPNENFYANQTVFVCPQLNHVCPHKHFVYPLFKKRLSPNEHFKKFVISVICKHLRSFFKCYTFDYAIFFMITPYLARISQWKKESYAAYVWHTTRISNGCLCEVGPPLPITIFLLLLEVVLHCSRRIMIYLESFQKQRQKSNFLTSSPFNENPTYNSYSRLF